jgi:hypothetical protein
MQAQFGLDLLEPKVWRLSKQRACRQNAPKEYAAKYSHQTVLSIAAVALDLVRHFLFPDH